jgi:hypothetical protein
MNKKIYIGIGVVLATLMLVTQTCGAQEIVRKNICARNMDNILEIFQKFINSEQWKKAKERLDSHFNETQLAIIHEDTTVFVYKLLGSRDSSPLAQALIVFMEGVYEIMAIFIGHNGITLMLAMVVGTAISLPVVVAIDCFASFLETFLFAAVFCLSYLPDGTSLYDIAYNYGVLGLIVWFLVIFPMVVAVFVAVMVVAFPINAVMYILNDFLDTYNQILRDMGYTTHITIRDM